MLALRRCRPRLLSVTGVAALLVGGLGAPAAAQWSAQPSGSHDGWVDGDEGQASDWQRAPQEAFGPERRGEPAARAAATADLERAIVDEMNELRRDPAGYARHLRALRPYYRGRMLQLPGQTPILTEEGVTALDEAISALEGLDGRRSVLRWSDGLAAAARDHARDLGERGHLGHYGSDGSTPDQRVGRHGKWSGAVAENITFGSITAREVVVDLLVDDGVADRGHREVLLARELRLSGVACGPHPTYRQTCVIDYAAGFEPFEAPVATSRARAVPERPPRAMTQPGPAPPRYGPAPAPERPRYMPHAPARPARPAAPVEEPIIEV